MTASLVFPSADLSEFPRRHRGLSSRAACALAVAGLMVSLPAAAGGDVVVGTLFGAGVGALVGQAFGGQQGAVVGGVIGAVAGNALASSDRHQHGYQSRHGVAVQYPYAPGYPAAGYPVYPAHSGWSAQTYPVGPGAAYVTVAPAYPPAPPVYVAPRPIYYPPATLVYPQAEPRHWGHHRSWRHHGHRHWN